MSATKDKIRPPYGQTMVEFPRRCSFVGTTNEETPLRDPHGHRRFWVVSVGYIDIPWIEKHRDQIWAESMAAYRTGEPHWLDNEQTVQAEGEASIYAEEEVTITEINSWLDTNPKLPLWINALYIHTNCLNRMPGSMRPEDSRVINRALKTLGFEAESKNINGRSVRGFSTIAWGPNKVIV